MTPASDGRGFVATPAAECGSTIVERENGGPYRRRSLEVRGPTPSWIQAIIVEKASELVVPPPARVVTLRQATVRGPGVITLPGRVVRESLINCENLDSVADLRRLDQAGHYVAEAAFAGGKPMPPAKYVLLKQMWDGNYGHWLVEGLPRVGLLAGTVELAACRFLVSSVSAAMHRIFVDSLGAFGVRPDQIMITGREPLYFEELIYPLPLTVQPWVKAPLAARILEQLGQDVLARSGQFWRADRLFVWRLPESRRPLRNQAALRDLLLRRGYAIVAPGMMDFTEQVVAFSGARRIIGTLGAECANLVFSPSGVRLLGLAPEHMQDDFFWDLVSHKGGRTLSLHSPSEDPDAGMNAAFTADLAVLEAMLPEFEAD